MQKEQNQYENSSECQDYADYGTDGYHPVYLGQKFNGQYSIVQKLGWGHFSTVWLVQNVTTQEYCALKIQRSKDNHADSALDELKILSQIMKHEGNQQWQLLIKEITQAHPKILPHPQLIRPLALIDNFAHHGIHGKHYCSAFELLGPNLLDVIQHYQFADQRMPIWLVKKITIDVLLGLQYLHTFCQIIHTDLKPENIMVKMTQNEEQQFIKKIKDYKVKPISMKYLKNLESSKNSKAKKKNEKKKLKKKLKKEQQQEEKAENQMKKEENEELISGQNQEDKQKIEQNIQTQIPTTDKQANLDKMDEEKQEIMELKHQQGNKDQEGEKMQNKQQDKLSRMRYLKWKNVQIELTTDLFFKVVDMGNACFINHHYTEDIQTRQYRSPEVLLGYSYGPTTDIWSLACTVFQMLTNTFLFKPKKISGISKDEDHLFRIIEVLGPISKQHALGGMNSSKFFNKKGKLLNGHPKQHARLHQLFHEDFGYSLQESVELEQFLLPMLEINDEKRITARQCLKSQWLWKQ